MIMMTDCFPDPIFLVRQSLGSTRTSTNTYRAAVPVRSEAESHQAALVHVCKGTWKAIYLNNALQQEMFTFKQ